MDAPESEVNQALKSLNTLIGSSFILETAWEDIYRDLKKPFTDNVDKLVPNVSRHIILFLQRLEILLEQDEAFQDKFLEEYRSLVGVLSVVVSATLKPRKKWPFNVCLGARWLQNVLQDRESQIDPSIANSWT